MNRFRRIKWTLFLAVLTVVSPRVSCAADPEDALIKGVSEFLLDRANDNYVYIFQRKLESNEVFRKYLPATYRVAKSGELRSLLTNRRVWKDALKRDLEDGPTTFADQVLGDIGDLINKKLCPADVPELKKPCDEARAALRRAKSRKEKEVPAESEVGSPGAKAPGETPPTDPKSLKPGERSSLVVTAFTATAQIELAARVLEGLKNDLEQVRTENCMKEDIETGKERKNAYTSCAIEVLALLEALAHADYVFNCFLMGNWCWNNQRDEKVREENDDFDDFKRYVIFFAQMADAAQANDPERVKVLLKSVTIPPVSFGIKREPHRTRVLITAYVGGAWARDKTDLAYDRTFVIAAPIGFEVSQARGSGNSLSLLVSPVDFGYPLSLKMQNSEATVRTSDIVVPSAYVLWGPKNYPFGVGVGYARVRNVDTDTREGRWLLFFGFDLPLFKLY